MSKNEEAVWIALPYERRRLDILILLGPDLDCKRVEREMRVPGDDLRFGCERT